MSPSQLSPDDVSAAIAALAIDHGLLSPRDAVMAIRDIRRGESAGPVLARHVGEAKLLATIAAELGQPFVDLDAPGVDAGLDPDLFEDVDRDTCVNFDVVPLRLNSQTVVLAANLLHADTASFIARNFPADWPRMMGVPSQIRAKLAMASSDLNAPIVGLEQIERPAAGGPATQVTERRTPLQEWVDNVLTSAVAQRASDIHIEQMLDRSLLLRFRIDGVLFRQPSPVTGHEAEVIGILMNRAGMDAGNLLEPQGGSFNFTAAGRTIDVRASMLPTNAGPRIVGRLLDPMTIQTRLEDMGFSTRDMGILRAAVLAAQGAAVVTGPTGSGKSSTMYGLVKEVAAVERNVMTIEDPIEYRLDLVSQTQVRHAGDRSLTFARGLREILRQDPEVVMVGEIRDAQTAHVALEAAMTGHVLLSTLHTNSAAGAFGRLESLGAPRYMVSEALRVIVGQRLVRRLHACARPAAPDANERLAWELSGLTAPDELLAPVGCDACRHTGFLKRAAVVETLQATPQIRAAVAAGAREDEIIDLARNDGFVPMLEVAASMVRDGITTMVEARSRVVSD